jgi:hypothetical protein
MECWQAASDPCALPFSNSAGPDCRYGLTARRLLPPSLHEFVAPGHLAHFVRDLMRETLDLTEILSGYDETLGLPALPSGDDSPWAA